MTGQMPCQYATVWLTYKLASVTFQPQLVFEKVGEPISHDALCAKLPRVRCAPSAPGSYAAPSFGTGLSATLPLSDCRRVARDLGANRSTLRVISRPEWAQPLELRVGGAESSQACQSFGFRGRHSSVRQLAESGLDSGPAVKICQKSPRPMCPSRLIHSRNSAQASARPS